MCNYKVFVDGAAGTTGLRIQERLAQQKDILVLSLPEAQRKDLNARAEMATKADVSILCLPDDASKELCSLLEGSSARICDTSTAYRTQWVYGFAELAGRRAAIASASRVAVPGCHASGFLALTAPLVERGAISASTQLACHSVTGYSGGGKSMISDYTSPTRPNDYSSPRAYGLGLYHKHLPEMTKISGLQNAPVFCPIVADYYAGMLVSVPLPTSALLTPYKTPNDIANLFAGYYANEPLIKLNPAAQGGTQGFLAANLLQGLDYMELFVFGNEEQILLCALFDNLGKGSSGAALQCMNLMLGRLETAGLAL